MKTNVSIQQCKRRRYCGNGDVMIGDFLWSCELYWRTSSGWTLFGALLIVIELCHRTSRGWTRVRSAVINSCVGGPEDNGRIRCNLRISCTCVRILEELLTVITSCVLNFECNKVPLWNRTYEYVTVLHPRRLISIASSLCITIIQEHYYFSLTPWWVQFPLINDFCTILHSFTQLSRSL
jgi:hypothetical protein